MKFFKGIVKALSLLAGGLLLMLGLVIFSALSFSDLPQGTNKLTGCASSSAYFVFGACLIALAISTTWPRRIMAAGLSLFALAVLFLAFAPRFTCNSTLAN
jgi:hypothetical protein